MHRATAVGVAASVVSLFVGGCGGDDPDAEAAGSRARQARQLAQRAGLPREVADFLALAAGAAGATYTVEYALEGGGSAVLTQRPPDRRVDITTGDRVQTAIVRDDEAYSCVRSGQAWRCEQATQPPSPGPFALGDLRRTTEELSEAKQRYDFSVGGQRVADVDARCLVTAVRPGQSADPARGERGVLCVSEEGVPLLAEGGRNQFRATRYRTAVDDDAFDLPADAR